MIEVVEALVCYHTNAPTVFIWRADDFWNGYVGHASLQLSNGTYTSW